MEGSTRSWTRHKAWPSASDATRCGVCDRPIEGRPPGDTASIYRHAANEPTGFDAERQKRLYERLDTILDALDTDHVPAPTRVTREVARHELFGLLETLSTWHGHDELWRTIERWRKDHHERA